MKFAALGRTHWLYDSIVLARSFGHEPVLIATAPAAREYRCTENEFERLALEIGCPYFCDRDAYRHVEAIRSASPDVAISVNWPNLLTPEVLDLFPDGVWNAHAGDLPRYRGNAAPNWAILSGEDAVILTIHRMSAGLDEGPILAQRSFPLDETTYISDVYAFLDEAVPQLFTELLNLHASGQVTAAPQGAEASTVVRGLPRQPGDSRIDWSLPSVQLARLVRASAEPFPGAYTFFGGDRLTIWRARSEPLPYRHLGTPGQVARIDRTAGEVAVLTGDGLLVLEQVSVPNGRRCAAADVIRSARGRLGLDLEARVAELSG